MIQFTDGTVTFATAAGGVSVVVFRGPPQLAQLQALRKEISALHRQYGVERASIAIVETAAMVSPDDAVRAEAAALARDVSSRLDATVLEGGGFRAAAVRAVMNGLALLGGRSSSRRTYSSLDAALDDLLALDCVKLSRDEILALVAEARGGR
jgi:hypothetical protein